MIEEVIGDNNEIAIKSDLGLGYSVNGNGNKIIVGANCRLGIKIDIRGDNNTVIIGDYCVSKGYIGFMKANNSLLQIGAETTIGSGALHFHEDGEIRIGSDCMFSTDVFISVSDMHPIYDKATGERINYAAPIIIEDHVWLGLRAIVNKGSHIGRGAVVGAGSVVSGAIPANALAAGVPAKVLRENVEWKRNF